MHFARGCMCDRENHAQQALRFPSVRGACLPCAGAIVVAGLIGTACNSSHTGEHSAKRVVAAAPSTAPATVAPTTTTTVRRPTKGAVTFAFGGDVHFEGILREKLLSDPDDVLDSIEPVLRASDIAMVNLETAITDRGSPQPKKYTFRAPATALRALRAGGIDVATMANNHGVDFGAVGLEDSLTAIRESGFPVVGIGANATQAYAPYRVTVHGERIAIIGATQVIDEALISTWTATATHGGVASAKNVDRLLAAVRAARRTSDTVVVYLHWGIETQTCPSQDQEQLAAALAAAGADVIVGSHTHRLLGGGRLGRSFVDYGLGNFAFYATDGPGTQSGVLEMTVTGRRVNHYTWAPAVIEGGTPHPLTGPDAQAATVDWNNRRGCTNLTP
jgi:poly-gamma-glutamate capsule biosynthesis protein CapA/YwtB (metallophosphatase superfamily)